MSEGSKARHALEDAEAKLTYTGWSCEEAIQQIESAEDLYPSFERWAEEVRALRDAVQGLRRDAERLAEWRY